MKPLVYIYTKKDTLM